MDLHKSRSTFCLCENGCMICHCGNFLFLSPSLYIYWSAFDSSFGEEKIEKEENQTIVRVVFFCWLVFNHCCQNEYFDWYQFSDFKLHHCVRLLWRVYLILITWKCTIWHLQTGKTQIRLHICAVWSVFPVRMKMAHMCSEEKRLITSPHKSVGWIWVLTISTWLKVPFNVPPITCTL